MNTKQILNSWNDKLVQQKSIVASDRLDKSPLEILMPNNNDRVTLLANKIGATRNDIVYIDKQRTLSGAIAAVEKLRMYMGGTDE